MKITCILNPNSRSKAAQEIRKGVADATYSFTHPATLTEWRSEYGNIHFNLEDGLSGLPEAVRGRGFNFSQFRVYDDGIQPCPPLEPAHFSTESGAEVLVDEFYKVLEEPSEGVGGMLAKTGYQSFWRIRVVAPTFEEALELFYQARGMHPPEEETDASEVSPIELTGVTFSPPTGGEPTTK